MNSSIWSHACWKALAPAVSSIAILFAGCQSGTATRVATDVLAAGAGGVIAAKASDNNPYVTLAGGVAALGLAEFAQAANDKKQREALAIAYEQGRSQNAQVAYDAIQNAQRNGRREGDQTETYSEIPVVIPEHYQNGVRIRQTVEYVPVSK